jgi:hypothetical protein
MVFMGLYTHCKPSLEHRWHFGNVELHRSLRPLHSSHAVWIFWPFLFLWMAWVPVEDEMDDLLPFEKDFGEPADDVEDGILMV